MVRVQYHSIQQYIVFNPESFLSKVLLTNYESSHIIEKIGER